jgi:hypothetical protein
MLKRALVATALSWIIWGCGTSQHGTQSQTDKSAAPEIIDYYAAEVIQPGATWRVYLHVQDDDGDMRNIHLMLLQRGRNPATSVTPIQSEHSREMVGFLFLRTPADSHLTADQFTLRVVVRDRQGNRSERVEFPLRFGRVPPADTPEKWEEFADRSLGSMGLRVVSSFQGARERRRR